MLYFEIDSVQTAEKISRLFCSLTTPDGVSTKYLFAWVTDHQTGKVYLEINNTQPGMLVLPVYKKANTTAILQEIFTALGTKITNAEKNKLSTAFNNRVKISVLELLPASLAQFTPPQGWNRGLTTKP